MKNYTKSLILNLGLFIAGLFTIFSGMLIQTQYHIGNHGNISLTDTVLGIHYSGWSGIHKLSIVVLSFLMIFHFLLHWKWYKAIVTKRILHKNKEVITLTIVFTLVALTGFIPWVIDGLEGSQLMRKAFMEIHDKLAIVLSVYLILHVVKRLKWFSLAFGKITNKHSE